MRSILVDTDRRATVLVCKLLLNEVKWLSFMQHLKNIRCPIQHKSPISVGEWSDLYVDIDNYHRGSMDISKFPCLLHLVIFIGSFCRTQH